MNETRPANGGTIAWRVSELERRVNDIHPEALVAEVVSLRKDTNTVKRLLWTLIVLVLTASATLTITLLQTSPHVLSTGH